MLAFPFTDQIVACLDPVSAITKYDLEASIVDVIIGDMLWNPDDIEGVSYENAMQIFNWDNDNGVYVVTIARSVLFHLTIKFMTVGMSFTKTALAAHAA